jgi:hypothetical protein
LAIVGLVRCSRSANGAFGIGCSANITTAESGISVWKRESASLSFFLPAIQDTARFPKCGSLGLQVL